MGKDWIPDSGYIWILLEQDKDRIVSKCTRGKIYSKTYPLIMNLRQILRGVKKMRKLTPCARYGEKNRESYVYNHSPNQ
jgi:hypothetical protein